MDLKYRIEKVSPYFCSFQVVAEESAAYAVVKFPKGWTIPDSSALKANFKVEIAPIQGGLCFVTEISNGTECIFDALDYVVDFNKKVEERKGLLLEKIKELQDLFASETLDKLKTLKFVFEPQKKGAKKAVAKKQEPVIEPVITAPDLDAVEMAQNAEETPQKPEKPAEPNPQENESSLMALAKSMAGE